jgi:RNA polymerase sigma-70 factor, ECF subfamily
MIDHSEAELLARCRRGDPEAWDALFDLHYAPTARFIFQLSNAFSREDTEEICQETFLSAIQHLGTFQGQSRFQTWLFRIATNKARDFREKQLAAKRGAGQVPLSLDAEDPETGLAIDPPGAEPGPDLALIGNERAKLVHAALDRLGEPCRQVIELRYFADLSYDEIAATLGLNLKTVSSRLSKCLDRLERIASSIFSGEKTESFPSNL